MNESKDEKIIYEGGSDTEQLYIKLGHNEVGEFWIDYVVSDMRGEEIMTETIRINTGGKPDLSLYDTCFEELERMIEEEDLDQLIIMDQYKIFLEGLGYEVKTWIAQRQK